MSAVCVYAIGVCESVSAPTPRHLHSLQALNWRVHSAPLYVHSFEQLFALFPGSIECRDIDAPPNHPTLTASSPASALRPDHRYVVQLAKGNNPLCCDRFSAVLLFWLLP
jgi:hypothetical protein